MSDKLHGWLATLLAGANLYVAGTIAGMLFTDQTAHRVASSASNGDHTGTAFGMFLWASVHAYMLLRSALRDV